jgi:hypothetical protein
MSLKDRPAEFDASRNRPPEVVATIRKIAEKHSM